MKERNGVCLLVKSEEAYITLNMLVSNQDFAIKMAVGALYPEFYWWV